MHTERLIEVRQDKLHSLGYSLHISFMIHVPIGDGSVQQIFTSGRKRVHAANYPVFATPKRKCQEPAVLPGESPLVRVSLFINARNIT